MDSRYLKDKSLNRDHSDREEGWGLGALEARRELIRRHYDENADKRNAYIKRNAYFYDLVGRIFGHLISPGRRVLQVGCQNGDFLSAVEAGDGVCVDISSEMVRVSSEGNSQYQYHWCPDEVLPKLEPFDDVIITNNGEVADIHDGLVNLKKCVKSDTRIYIYTYRAPLKIHPQSLIC